MLFIVFSSKSSSKGRTEHLTVVIEKEVSITGFNYLKLKLDKVEERWGELLPYIQWSQEVLSIIAGTRNGDIKMLFKVTNTTNKSTKISHVAIRKRRKRRVILESSFWEETSRKYFLNGDAVVWSCGRDMQASHQENQREKLKRGSSSDTGFGETVFFFIWVYRLCAHFDNSFDIAPWLDN